MTSPGQCQVTSPGRDSSVILDCPGPLPYNRAATSARASARLPVLIDPFGEGSGRFLLREAI